MTDHINLWQLADRFPTDTETELVAVTLMKTFAEQEPDHPISRFPISFVATFVDMAKAVLAAQAERELAQ